MKPLSPLLKSNRPVINTILFLCLIIAVVITFGVGINIINRDKVLTYEEYSKEVCMLDDGWTIVTYDEKPSAHFEHTVLVTKDGYEILTTGE